jgi:hypothetical protein
MLNQLENKIRKAIPELMELGVGCEFTDNVCNDKHLILSKDKYGFKIYDYKNNEILKNIKLSSLMLNGIEIIGKQIQLNHVLEYVLEVLGVFNEDVLRELYFLWNLKSNLLSEQSSELIKYINEL